MGQSECNCTLHVRFIMLTTLFRSYVQLYSHPPVHRYPMGLSRSAAQPVLSARTRSRLPARRSRGGRAARDGETAKGVDESMSSFTPYLRRLGSDVFFLQAHWVPRRHASIFPFSLSKIRPPQLQERSMSQMNGRETGRREFKHPRPSSTFLSDELLPWA